MMKQLVILFITTLFVQSLNAQDIVILDEEGHMMSKDGIVLEEFPVNVEFKEAASMPRSLNQIVVQTIDGSSIKSSSSLKIGKSYYLFEVKQAEDTTLIGKPVVCQIIARRKSNISGSEGRLILRPLYVDKGSIQVPLVPNDICRRGLNRTNFKFWTSFLVIPIFIAGSGVKIMPEEHIILTLDLEEIGGTGH